MNKIQTITVKFMAMSKGLEKAQQKVQRGMDKIAKSTKRVVAVTKTLNKTFIDGFNATSQEVIRFNGNLLSLLFFGMAMKQVFMGALKSIYEGYKKIIP